LGDKIYFSGTTSTNDSPYVTITIYDLNNKFVLLTSGIADNNHRFQILVDTSTQSNQPKFSLTGTYSATAFTTDKTKGATTTFYFDAGNGLTTNPPIGSNQITITKGSSSGQACVTTNNCFDPANTQVAPGDTVIWTNADTASHTVTSGHQSDNVTGTVFDSSLVKAGGTFAFKFTDAGTFNYYCQVHPWMIGQIVVGNGGTPLPNPTPQPTPTSISVTTDKSSYYTGEIVTAHIVLSGATSGQNIAISFTDPAGNTIITRTVTTDSTGSASSQFKIPIVAKAGTYQVITTASVNNKDFNTSAQFSVQQKSPPVTISFVQATDQQGNPVSSFSRGTSGFVKVVLSAQTSTPTLVTVNLFDSDYTTLGIGSFKITLGTGQSEVILSFPIPNDAVVGSANIYTDAFTDWPSNGGKPLTGESSAAVEIK
jgi:plastocyanin